MRDRRFLLGSLALVVAASGFGMLGPVARLAYETGFHPMSFVAWRAAMGFLSLVAIVAVAARRGTPVVHLLHLERRDAIGLVVVAVAGLGVNIATFVAFDLTTVALVLLAFYTYPALVAVVAVALGHERIDRPRLVALGLALGGMVLVVAGGLDPAPGGPPFNPVGVLLGLVAAACQTVFVTVSRERFATMPSVQVIAWVLLLIAGACLAVAVVLGDPLDVPLHEPSALGFAILAGVIGAGVPSVLFLVGIRAIGGTRAGILMLLEPVVGVALAAIILGESLRPIQVAGGIAILAAAAVLQRGASAGQDSVLVPVAEHP